MSPELDAKAFALNLTDSSGFGCPGWPGGWAADELVTKFEAETSVRVVLAVLAVPIVLPDRKC